MNSSTELYRVEPRAIPHNTAMSAEEPKCLINPQSKWYRPGQGFTCRQIMMPLMLIAALLVIMIAVQAVELMRMEQLDLIAIGFVAVPSMMLALVIRAILFVRRSLLDPLTQVRYWVSKVRSGDLTARMPSLSTGEFDELADDINDLAEVMETLHDDLEAEVAAKTDKLARKTQALELLYEVVTLVNESYETEDLLRHFMRRLADVYQANAVVLRGLKESKLVLLESFGLSQESSFMEPAVPIRFVLQNNVFGDDQISVRSETINEILIGQEGKRSIRQIISIPLQHRDSILGSYQLFVPGNNPLDDDDCNLLANVGRHLGVLMEQSRLDHESGKLMMIEERARLANELHDSLAQTLASLRFQVRVLDETLHQGDEQVTWEELEKLENQVEEANGELRLLIGRFRAPLQSQEVIVSVQKLIAKFRRDTGVAVFFQNEWSDDDLPIEMRTDVIRIIQEALANIKKHAEANSVRVLIRYDSRGCRVLVEDDGKGYDEDLVAEGGPGEHIGRQIMQERADNLNAELGLESEIGEGSSVSLDFKHMPLHSMSELSAVGT